MKKENYCMCVCVREVVNSPLGHVDRLSLGQSFEELYKEDTDLRLV